MSDFTARIVKPAHVAKRAILLKGPSGSGKSFQFRKLHEAGWKGLYACVNEHVGTVEDLDPDTFYIQKLDVPLTPADKNPQVQDFIALMDFLRGPHTYDFLYFDSLMNYADELVYYLKYEKRLSGYDLWLVFGEKMKMLLKLLVSLTKPQLPKPVHVIATWGVEVAQDWEGRRSKEPIIDGKMVGPRISYYFDDVFMLSKKETPDGDVKFLLYTGGTHEFDAKVSSGDVKLPTVVENPDLSRIIRKIQGEL